MKFGIFGAGSIGCHVGGMLAAAGNEVVLVGRETMGARLAQGIVLTRFDGMERFAAPQSFEFSSDPALLADCDVILLCMKSIATHEAAKTMAGIVRPDAVVVSLHAQPRGLLTRGGRRRQAKTRRPEDRRRVEGRTRKTIRIAISVVCGRF